MRHILLLLPLLSAACVTTSDTPSPTANRTAALDSPWIAPSPQLEREIRSRVAQLPFTHSPEEQVAAIEWFTAQDEVAFPFLLEVLEKAESGRAILLASAALASSRDQRLVPYVQEIPFPAEEYPKLRYDRARLLMTLGDWSRADVLIAGLEDEDPLMRAMCSASLESATGLQMGFSPRAEAEVREAAVGRWNEWWQARAADPLLHR